MSATPSRLLVAAMDIGTTYSGYAYSFRDTPDDIHTNPCWVAGSERLISLKNPTCVLLKPNKKFHSFGFEAENKYSDLAEEGQHHGWYMFRRFKMRLYETETLNTRVTGIKKGDIDYVITVPAIWDEKAKQFMKKAANQAGIDNNQLKIALEPEAASIWCQVATETDLSKLSQPGAKYMVVDFCGATADITVHEKLSDGTLKELHTANGGAWGGNEVDKAYLELLTKIVGEGNMAIFKNEQNEDLFDILRDFEIKKRAITPEAESKVTLKFPASLRELVEKDGIPMKHKVEQIPDFSEVAFTSDKLRIPKQKALELFRGPISSLLEHVKNILEKPLLRGVNSILLVGGYSECELVKAVFDGTLPQKDIVIPADAGLAVLKGAVRYGHLPNKVSTRVSRFAFGREIWEDFNIDVDDPKRMTVQGGHKVCKFVFEKFVDVGEAIPVGRKIQTFGKDVHVGQKTAAIKIYATTDPNTLYTNTLLCKYLGTLVVNLTKSKDVEDTYHTIDIEFGNTTIKVTVVIPKTKKIYESEFRVNDVNMHDENRAFGELSLVDYF